MIAEHPAGLDQQRRLWFGPEVEGAYAQARTPTAFVSARLCKREVEQILERKVEQVFLTETFAGHGVSWIDDYDWEWFEKDFWPRLRHDQMMVTVGRYPSQVPAFNKVRGKFAGIRLMVHVLDAPWVHTLKAGDEISLGVPYHLWTYRLEDGVETKPEHYRDDTE
jgi:hypothetical protein